MSAEEDLVKNSLNLINLGTRHCSTLTFLSDKGAPITAAEHNIKYIIISILNQEMLVLTTEDIECVKCCGKEFIFCCT